MPTGLSISGGDIIGTPLVDNQSCEITVTAYNDYELDGVSKAFTLRVASAPYINTESPLRNGILNQAYTPLSLAASGVTPITWEIVSGVLPNGMNLSEEGVLDGTPLETGTFSIGVRASNSLGTDNKIFSITINELPVITTSLFGNGRIDTYYSGQLTATGTTPITYTITAGGLPTGLTLNSSTGQISGTALGMGTFNFTVIATNAARKFGSR